MYINNLGHMTKMAAMPIYGKNPSKIIFSETNRLISRKLGVRHRWLKYSNVYINHDPVMTLTKFMARSTWVGCASELGKLLKCHLKEKANRKLASGQNIEDSEKRKWPKGLSAMTKMAAMPIYGKNPSKIFFSGTTGPISTKLDMKH